MFMPDIYQLDVMKSGIKLIRFYQLRKEPRKAKSHCFARSGRHGRQGVILDCNKDGSHESNSLVGEALLMLSLIHI